MTRTKDQPDRNKLLTSLASAGIQFNAFTGYEYSHYYCNCLPSKLNEALHFLTDGINKTIISADDVEREKSIILDEESRNRNDPESYLWRLNHKALWPSHGMGGDFYGDKTSISKIRLNDIIEFKNTFYNNPTWVIISGHRIKNIPKKLHQLSPKKHTGSYPAKEVKTRTTLPKPTPIMIEQGGLDENLLIGWSYQLRRSNSKKDLAIARLVREYLSNNWTSKLVEELRINNNLTYWVDGETADYTDTGSMSFKFSTKKNNLLKCLKIMDEQTRNLSTDLIEDERLKQIKTVYLSKLAQNYLNPDNLRWWFGEAAALEDDLYTLTEYKKVINDITSKEIIIFSRKYLKPDNRSVVIIGDVTKQKIQKMLGV